ncbi:hypothetical protein ACWKWU_13505 [Chitinophaga lutea]
MPIFAYADETAFFRSPNDKNQTLGCAILVCEREISNEVINEALGALWRQIPADVGIKDSIKKTLVRGHFHASKDSDYAKKCLLDAINKRVKGVLCVSYYDTITIDSKKVQENFFKRCMSSSSLELFRSMEEINLIIEKRDGFQKVHAEEWRELVYRQFENSSFDLPSFKTFFPKININLGGKTVPGLQVVDFLLWSVNRSRLVVPQSDWINRLRFVRRYHTGEVGLNHNFGHYYLNSAKLEVTPGYPINFKESETNEELLNAWLLIERFFWILEESDFAPGCMHLYTGFVRVKQVLKKPDYFLKESDLMEAGRVFIRLFDSMPLYSHISNNDFGNWALLHHAKHLATLILMPEYLHTGRTRDYIAMWRYEAQSNNLLESMILI